jgi:3-oxoacyl-[acyl-carrier-protein] synthase II
MERRVVITAASAITPVGRTEAEIMDHLTAGRSGVRSLKEDQLLAGLLNSKVFGTVAYDIAYDFPRKYAKTMGPVAFYACQVAKESSSRPASTRNSAPAAAWGWPSAPLRAARRCSARCCSPVHGGPGRRAPRERRRLPQVDDAHGRGQHRPHVLHHGSDHRLLHGMHDQQPVDRLCYEAIKFGLADVMLCGGADEYDTTTVAVFDQLLVASHAFNATPERTPSPFDRRRDGLVIGEGAGAVMLEEYEFARRRGAEILGEVLGFANCNNGGDMILPSTAGIELTLRTAFDAAGIAPSDVDLVSAHATATRFGDVIEAQAMHSFYGIGRGHGPQELRRPHDGHLRGDGNHLLPVHDEARRS